MATLPVRRKDSTSHLTVTVQGDVITPLLHINIGKMTASAESLSRISAGLTQTDWRVDIQLRVELPSHYGLRQNLRTPKIKIIVFGLVIDPTRWCDAIATLEGTIGNTKINSYKMKPSAHHAAHT
jgi:hypothetical protein